MNISSMKQLKNKLEKIYYTKNLSKTIKYNKNSLTFFSVLKIMYGYLSNMIYNYINVYALDV